MIRRIFVLLPLALGCCVHANAQPATTAVVDESAVAVETVSSQLESLDYTVKEGKFQGFVQTSFQMEGGVNCIIAQPKKPAAGNPWVWRARFWGHQPQLDRAMLERGWHVAYCDVGNLLGADSAVQRWDRFYAVSQKLDLSPKPLLEGMSRGGLIIMRWATANPDQVCGIYADNAVIDMRSWPGGKGASKGNAGTWQHCLKAYGITDEESADFADGALDRLEPLAKAKVPIFALVNEADNVVPPAENSNLLESKYSAFGGPIEVMRRPGLGHHPHCLKDPTPLVEFALKSFEATR